MKYLDAKQGIEPGENKMKPGNRADQQAITQAETDAKVIKLAAQFKIDLAKVKGTGKNGTITEQDVRNAAGPIGHLTTMNPPKAKE